MWGEFKPPRCSVIVISILACIGSLQNSQGKEKTLVEKRGKVMEPQKFPGKVGIGVAPEDQGN